MYQDDQLRKFKRKKSVCWYASIKETIDYIYMQFLLTTTLYVMEPWERILMITIFILILSLITYSAFVFIPYHVHKIAQTTIPLINSVFFSS